MKKQILFSLLALTIGSAQLSASLEQNQKQTTLTDLVEKYVIQPPCKVLKSVQETVLSYKSLVSYGLSAALLAKLYNSKLYTGNDNKDCLTIGMLAMFAWPVTANIIDTFMKRLAVNFELTDKK